MSIGKILAINPSPRHTNIAVYQGANLMFLKKIKHSEELLLTFREIADQTDYRTDLVLKELRNNDIDLSLIKVVIGRGGLVKPLESGIYAVNERLKEDLKAGIQGQHANNLGGLIADKMASILPNAKAYIADPVVVDEMEEVAKVTGHPKFTRRSVFHALNQKSVARKYANSIGRKYEDLNLLVVHIESGISVGAHQKGRVIDVNQAFDGGGPFSFERTGTLPVGDLLRAAYSGEYTIEELYKMVTSEGGLLAYLGIKNLGELENRVETLKDKEAEFITYSMSYQVSKEIGSMAAVLKFQIDGVVLSGEIFHWKRFTDYVSDHVNRIAPIAVYPNENEMDALASNGYMILSGEAEIKEYK